MQLKVQSYVRPKDGQNGAYFLTLQKEGKLTREPFVRCLTRQREMKWSASVEKGELVL